MESKEIARVRVLALIDNREPAGIVAEAKFHLRPNTVSEWRAKRSNTYMNILPEIAKEYGVTTDWLLGVEREAVYPDMIEVKTVGSIKAGYPIESYPVIGDSVQIPADIAPSGEVFALDVVGDSMYPLVFNGDKIICEKTDDRRANGKICVVTVGGESTLKRVRIDSNGITLIPINPMYQEIHYNKKECAEKNLSIDGVLVQSVRRF